MKGILLWTTSVFINISLLAHQKDIVRLDQNTKSIWDFPRIWIAIIVLIIIGLAIANRSLNNFK
jgi:hypothetical protein